MGQDEIAPGAPTGVIHCVPLPAWVQHEPYADSASGDDEAYVGNGLCRLLYDTQVDLSGIEYAWHVRTVRRVLTRAGAEQVAHVTVEYDPLYERPEVHFVRVVRGEERIEHAKPDRFQILRRETNLNRLVLDGRLTASLLIADVRIGDVVEIALTLRGANPALGGKHTAWVAFDDFNPAAETRYRLLRAERRAVSVKRFNEPPALATSKANGIEDMRWRVVRPARREAEDYVPPWRLEAPTLHFSEFSNWAEVVDLFAPLYESAALPETLASEIDKLAAAYGWPDERAAEWLRFVQRELRYFALSFGEGGYVPRPLDDIWSSRFGDCKDAARLYVAGARRLGLDACAALTSTTHSKALDGFLPASNVFNHCIVRLQIDGKSYWLDPTVPSQSGRLAIIYQPHSGWALPLAPGTTALESMGGDEPIHHLNWEDEIRFGPRKDSPAMLRRQVEYYSWAADAMRHQIANEGTTGHAKTLLQAIQAVWPKVVETAAVSVDDDSQENCLTLVLRYEIPDCWKADEKGKNLAFNIIDGVLPGELGLLKSGPRQSDIYLARPRRITRRTTMIMPRRWAGEGWSRADYVTGATYTDRLAMEGRSIVNSKELAIDAWFTPPSEAVAYNALATRLNENQLSIWGRQRFGRIGSSAGILGFPVGKVQSIAFGVFIALIVARLISMLLKQP